ncbi:hypothetical protein KR054_009961 [Drosophila jambulina]|nr:hypothetical protein KR054_009961 [Drosophila jambulina]
MSSCGSRQRKTAKSSRIPPQAREYITEMAEDRELERFMALSSTASSGASGSLHTCAVRVSLTTEPAAASRPGSGHRARRPRSRECQTEPEGAAEEALLPLLASPTDQQTAKPMRSKDNSPAADSYRIIPIVMVEDQSKSRPVAATQTMSLSVEDLRTPTKLPAEMHTKKTQTPESALKSHKRLEWDPAADVGYYKRAVSTSNISTLERSVLEECGWRQPLQQQQQQQQQRSETDLDRLQREESGEKADTPMQEKTNVPLASSTMVSRQVASAGVSGRADSYSSSRAEESNGRSRADPLNSSSKREASLSSHKKEVPPSGHRREAPLSSSKSVASHCSSKDSFKHDDSASSSRRETTSLSSSKKETPCSSASKHLVRNSSSVEALQAQVNSRRESLNSSQRESHISSRKESLISSQRESHMSSRRESHISSRRESLASNSQAASRLSSRAENSQNSSRMGSEMSSRRESQGTSLYGSSAASSFDYHVNMEQEQEWLKSMQKQQQREQRREQSHRSSDQHQEPSGTDHREENARQTEHKNKDQKTEHKNKDQKKAELRRAEQREKEREQERQFTAAQFERILLGSRRRENKENRQPQSISTSASASSLHASATAAAGHKRDLDLGIDLLCSLVEARSLSQGQKKSLVRDIARRIACLDLAETSSTTSSRRERTRGENVPVTVPKPVPPQRQDVATNTSLAGSRSSSLNGHPPPTVVTLPIPAPRKRNADGTPSPLPSSSISATISSTSASNEIITQKTNVPTRDAASTDADVEADADADTEPMSAIREALTPMTQSEIEYEERMKAGMDPERRSQLNWIEAEIERLQSLKVFLAEVKDKLPSSCVPMAAGEELMISSDELLLVEPQETEQKEEEEQKESSPEEVASRGKKAARQLAKAVQTEELQDEATPKPPVRIESVRVPPRMACDLQAPPLPPPHRYQRTKMATPVLASHSSSSGRSESVSSFVQQRHRRFREHYQNQQQQQLLLLKQQQLQRLQQQHKHQQKQQQQQQQQQQLCQHKHQPRVVIVHEEQHIACESHRPTHVVRQQHKRLPREQHQEQREHQQYMQMAQYDQTVASGSAYATPHSSASGCYSCADNERERAIYYQVVNSPGASASYVQAEPMAAPATTTTSGSSLMCLSSEMSIPMGRVDTGEATTTTTTTHQYDDVACQRRKRRVGEERMQRQTLQVRPSGIAYVIQFGASGSGEVVPETRSLQDQLQLARPEFCAKSKQRKAILNQMQMMRNLRRQEMDELVAENNGSLETLDRRLRLQLPPPATSRLRIFTTKEMKAMTTKKCQRLPEVLDAVNREVEMRRRRTNRLMRDIFNKRMRSRVSNGQVSLNHSRTII